MPLTDDQRGRVDAALDAVLDLTDDARPAALRRIAADDPAVFSEVESLLAAAAASGAFLDRPAKPEAISGIDAPALDAGQRIGAWKILGTIGRGGMGDVYEAERADGAFAQRVAIKLLRREASEQLGRFHAERQILARLAHHGIAALHDGGVTEDGRPWMAMELVHGSTLTEWCAANAADLDTRLRLFESVCDVVAHAHLHLVVHRDLKPANILVTPDGAVKLLDFGIAKLLDAADAQQTRTLAAPMTPLYAAPEQLTGGTVTTATDVYALGLLLFELLTGQSPWAATSTTAAQVLRAVQQDVAPLASATAAKSPAAPLPARSLRGDLDAIVAKALRAEPTHRYATVDALRRDVEHARLGEAVAAREGARVYAAVRALRRHRWVAAGTAIVIVSLATGLGAAAWQARRAEMERDLARHDAAREEALRYHLTGLFRSAIADHGASSPTAKNMLDKSARRVLDEYRDQPVVAGQVVLTLVDLYEALEDVEGSASLLEGFLAQAGPTADPFAVADARQKLAGIELLRGHVAEAGRLLDQSERFWAETNVPHTEERLEGLNVRARWLRSTGDLAGSIALDQSTIQQRIAFSGHDHRETATAYNSLAITLASANRLDESLAAYRETVAIYDKLGLGEGLDAQIIRGNMGALALRAGHLADAAALLQGAIEHERALAGDSAAVAASLAYEGRRQTIVGEAAAARGTLSSAVTMGSRYTGPASPLTLQARLFLGDAESAAGDDGAAHATLEALLHDAAARYGEKSVITLRTRVALAALATKAHAPRDAEGALTPVIGALRMLGPPAQASLALALQVIGEAEIADHDAAAAIAPLREAASLRVSEGAQHWELAVARERLAEALAASGAKAEAESVLAGVVATQTAQLGPAHAETLRARRIDAALHTAEASAGRARS